MPQLIPQRRSRKAIEPFLVTAEEMQQIERRLFEAGLPVAALMEKVSAQIVRWFVDCFGLPAAVKGNRIGILAGPGHNGGDALAVARELHHLGYAVRVYQPFARCKPLAEQHARYARHLGIAFCSSVQGLADCDALIDGWFGFGLTRPIEGERAADIAAINQQQIPVFSLDLPSGIHTDSGQVMGVAIKATRTACLGLWKRAFMAATALAYCGQCDLIDFDIPLADITAVLGKVPDVQRLTDEDAIARLPLKRAPDAHKYTTGHLLVIAGSRQYAGAALLTGLGATASGVGMLTLAVPESIRLALLSQLPGALLVGCPETADGAISQLPASINLEKYDAIAFGPGLTPTVPALLETLLQLHCPLLLDADGLNLLAQGDPIEQLQARSAPSVLVPHVGEFRRLFPQIASQSDSQAAIALPGEMARQAAQASGAAVLLKGPRSAIAAGWRCWFNPHSTAALARGGSGDVLTGLMGGLMASAARAGTRKATLETITPAVLGAVWWHSQAACYAQQQRTVLGADPRQLASALNPSLQAAIARLT